MHSIHFDDSVAI